MTRLNSYSLYPLWWVFIHNTFLETRIRYWNSLHQKLVQKAPEITWARHINLSTWVIYRPNYDIRFVFELHAISSVTVGFHTLYFLVTLHCTVLSLMLLLAPIFTLARHNSVQYYMRMKFLL